MCCLLYIMDNMLEENKNLKSHIKDTSPTIVSSKTEVSLSNGQSSIQVSYTKTNKLISALYMVTEIMDKEEPLRNKLRSLGTNIISDIHSSNKGQDIFNQINNRVSELLSFIEIASSVGIMSEMNSSILVKEFNELRKLTVDTTPKKVENWLQEFMKENDNSETEVLKDNSFSKGHTNLSSHPGNRIGVQRGSTLMKALSDRIPHLSNINNGNIINNNGHRNESINVLKNKRHDDIILVIKDKMKSSENFDGVTITDIKSLGQGTLVSCGEKTLQRELVSMVSSGILKKTGEKRWSKYFLVSHN